MKTDDLLEIAADLVRREPTRPRQASLKRAVSTAYFAIFHALARECVAQTVGWRIREGHWDAVTPMYRAMDHGPSRALLRRVSTDTSASPELRTLAQIFVDLQAERIRADYDPKPAFNRRDAQRSVDLARQAVGLLLALPEHSKRLLAVQLITKSR